jgi:hypothetical protein
MSEFLIYFQIGLKHVLDIHAYDHVLFLIALVVPFSFKDWNELYFNNSFTIGHTVALLLSVFGIIAVKVNVVELLIPITILITAFFNCSPLAKKESINLILSPFLGIIHGLGFSNYFKAILGGSAIKVIAFGRICCGN